MASKSIVTREGVRDIYDRHAKIYDLTVWFYYLAGMRIGHWRRMTVDALGLEPGDTVIEVGCGTGLNFSLLERVVGNEGKIIGIDISQAMLDRARERVRAAGWTVARRRGGLRRGGWTDRKLLRLRVLFARDRIVLRIRAGAPDRR